MPAPAAAVAVLKLRTFWKLLGAISGILVLGFIAVIAVILMMFQGAVEAEAEGACTFDGATVQVAAGAPSLVAGYTAEQVSNAAAIMNAGATLGLGVRDQTIGVMTALGESGLRVLDYGDKAGPDSRGLFQQRDNGAWGTYEDRMDPTRSATSFFTVLAKISGRDAMAPSAVAHKVQVNADPNHYTKYWTSAVQIVGALAGTDLSSLAMEGGGITCATPAGGDPNAAVTGPGEWGGHANGKIPDAQMCVLFWDMRHRLRCDATGQLAALSTSYKARFGRDICVTDAYRTYASQVFLKAEKGYLAATPGTSNHGWGLAVDLCGGVNKADTPEYLWMRANAPAYGWDNPAWARVGGSKPEAWHWEFNLAPTA